MAADLFSMPHKDILGTPVVMTILQGKVVFAK